MITPPSEGDPLESPSIEITLLYFPSCPHWQTADSRLGDLVAESDDVTLSRTVIDTEAAAQATGFCGSPTIRIDGVDPFADPDAPVGLACRLYLTPDGYAGSPTLEQLRDAVRNARRSRQ